MSRTWKIVWAIVLAAVVVSIGYVFYRQRRMEAALAREMALFKAAGGSERIEDLLPKPGEPGCPTHWIDLGPFERLQANPNLPPPTAPVPAPEDWAYVKAEIAAGDGAYEITWDGAGTLLPHLSRFRQAARMLAAEASKRAADGDMRGALEDVRLAFRTRRLVAREPIAISTLVAMATDNIARGALLAVLQEGDPDRESVEALLAELDDHEALNNRDRMLLGEAAFGLEFIDRVKADPEYYRTYMNMLAGTSTPVSQIKARLFVALYNATEDKTRLLECNRRLRAIAALPFPERAGAPPVAPPQAGGNAFAPPLTRMLVPGLLRAPDQQVQADAWLALTRISLGLSLYHAERGAYPDALGALVPDYLPRLDVDPYSRSQCSIVTMRRVFTIYCCRRRRDRRRRRRDEGRRSWTQYARAGSAGGVDRLLGAAGRRGHGRFETIDPEEGR